MSSELSAIKGQQDYVHELKKKDRILQSLQEALKMFQASNSQQKKRVIQTLVQKAVLNLKEDKLYLYIDPFLEPEKRRKADFGQTPALLPKSIADSANVLVRTSENNSVFGCHIEEKPLCVEPKWRGLREFLEAA